jgi:propanol-preferring alcohol dehydrogenase
MPSPWPAPFTLGHENAGWVHSVGQGVEGLEIGLPVAVYGPWGCGRCVRCSVGIETLCEDQAHAPIAGGGGGIGLDGGMAEYLLVPAARHLVALPDGLDPVTAAPLTDAALTPYHAIRRSLPKLTADSTTVAIGVGGLGHLGIQILKALSATRIVAVDPKRDALALAEQAGADLVLQPGPTTVEDVRAFTRSRGADLVLDFVGSTDTIALAVSVSRSLGDVTVVGIAGGNFNFTFFGIPHEVSMQTTYWGSRPELVEVLDLGARGLIEPHTSVYSLSDAPEAYRRLRAGELSGRAVIDPSLG